MIEDPLKFFRLSCASQVNTKRKPYSYGNLFYHKNDNNMLIDDWAFLVASSDKEWLIIDENLSITKCCKLLPATLKGKTQI